jgi:hypothetical protein
MPELRSSTRQARLRSKKLDDSQPAEPAAKPVLPGPQRGGRHTPTRAARGRKGASARKVTPPKRKGIDIVELKAEPICKKAPKAVAGKAVVCEAKKLALDKVVKGAPGPRMDGESAEKLVGVEDESTTSPVPERV